MIWRLYNKQDGRFWLVDAPDRAEAIRIRNEQGWEATNGHPVAYLMGIQRPGEFRIEEHLEMDGEKVPF
jgi:hypothetical protein